MVASFVRLFNHPVPQQIGKQEVGTMRFFVTVTENVTSSPTERAAMIQHRMKSLDYQQGLLNAGSLGYAFRSVDCQTGYLLYKADTLEQVDEIIKADPQWVFCSVEVMPVTTTTAMVKEMYRSFGPQLLGAPLSDSDLQKFEADEEAIDPDGNYSMAAKALAAVSPLASQDVQNDLWVRTLQSQKMHFNPIEFCDHNPVGKPWGILVGKCDVPAIQTHVASTPIYPDTVVTYTELLTLKKAWRKSASELAVFQRAAPVAVHFT
ncbi:hypothetical protein GAY29_14285 [Azospirillum brasilense]|uniref:hypothetical protein n=1 Tax=Azospirillum brasilense TaxID=192 RepID=UPI00190E589A|nr:hypothetical protein [Azospirillum brasilense]MBK3734256.1 hypothetical protein [Azospirillum brasilense]